MLSLLIRFAFDREKLYRFICGGLRRPRHDPFRSRSSCLSGTL
jgi:hypothetical protein